MPFYINQEESAASSIYHALQTSLRMNNWHGLTSQANFVWSHSIDNASDSEDFIPNQAQPQNSFNPAAERGNSSFDIRRRFTWNFGYEFPKMGGSMAKLKNGWGFDGVLNLQDGQPFQLNYNSKATTPERAKALIVRTWSGRFNTAAIRLSS